jgi:hypothetical protein
MTAYPLRIGATDTSPIYLFIRTTQCSNFAGGNPPQVTAFTQWVQSEPSSSNTKASCLYIWKTMSLGGYAMGYVGIPCFELNDVYMCLAGLKSSQVISATCLYEQTS